MMKHCLIVCGVNDLKWNWLNEVSIHTNEKGHILGENGGKIGSVNDRLKDLNTEHNEFFLITNIETLRDKNIQQTIFKPDYQVYSRPDIETTLLESDGPSVSGRFETASVSC